LLGLGTQSVIKVGTNEKQQMCTQELMMKLKQSKMQGECPFAVVLTAGTTDFGSIDNIKEVSGAIGSEIWIHVDAAYGGALKLSDTYQDKLEGIELADSMTIDFHKLFFQPISCGAFLLKDASHFGLMKMNAEYLNPESDEADGIMNLVTKSIQTTRRFDALKLYVTMQTLGSKRLGQMIDHTIALAQSAASLITNSKTLELYNYPEINAVVFRFALNGTDMEYDGNLGLEEENLVNSALYNHLLYTGKAMVAKTKINHVVYLKFTILNPLLTHEQLADLIDYIQSEAETIKQEQILEKVG
jgi:L-2,4-diaminobutyrate decarboxylase